MVKIKIMKNKNKFIILTPSKTGWIRGETKENKK